MSDTFLSLGDSALHITEKVMRSLNECLGDGRSIPIEYSKDGLLGDNGTCLHKPSKDEINRVQKRERES